MNLEHLKTKKLIFTVTTGRSGTGFLAEQLKSIADVDVFHEAEPGFHDYMRPIIEGQEDAKRFLLNQKLPFIEQSPSGVYIETSHVFCKGFLEPLLELGLVPDLILLKRPEREIAKSLYQLGTIPGRDPKALKFYLAPEDPIVYLPLPNWQDMHDYQLCFWYTLEIKRRQQVYKSMITAMGGKIVEIYLEELSRGNGMKKIIQNMNLNSPPAWRSLKRVKKVNTKANKKKSFGLPDDTLFTMEREVYNITNFLGIKV